MKACLLSSKESLNHVLISFFIVSKNSFKNISRNARSFSIDFSYDQGIVDGSELILDVEISYSSDPISKRLYLVM